MLSPLRMVLLEEVTGNNYEFLDNIELVDLDDIVNLRYRKKRRFKDDYKFLFWATGSISLSLLEMNKKAGDTGLE